MTQIDVLRRIGYNISAMLQGYRALDLAGEEGFLCGRILADLGVDVIKLERPGGDSCRNKGPFYHDIPHPERSLFWMAFNANKRGITLNLETRDGKELFLKLVKKSDFVIESFPPGHMGKLGLDYAILKEINPRIIMTSITPFGQTGPYKDYKATDIELMASGGVLFTTGDPDRPPIRLSFPIAYLTAGADAATATLIAHHYREKTGEGQNIDVSAQQALIWFTLNIRGFWEMEKKIIHRTGQSIERRPGVFQRTMWPCKDGAVFFFLLGGAMGPRSNRSLAQWIIEEGIADDFFKSFDWDSFDWGKTPPEVWTRLEDTIGQFFPSYTKAELYEEARKRGIILAPINSIRDVAHDPQLAHREYWLDVEHPELETLLTYPGVFTKSSLTPCTVKRRAPLIGEHNEEIYSEIGVPKEQLLILKQTGVI